MGRFHPARSTIIEMESWDNGMLELWEKNIGIVK